MSKRTQDDIEGSKSKNKNKPIGDDVDMIDDSSDDGSEDDRDMINVDFEFFDPQEHDFHGIKSLLRQLLDVDSTLIDLSALTDLILEQKLVGSTVKVDGREGDPYAFLTVINLKLHKDKPVVQSLFSYLKEKSTGTKLEDGLKKLLDTEAEENIAVVLCERLLNMPMEISPPMYNMLHEEIGLAIEDNEPYEFSNYLLISKVYAEIESKLDTEDSPRPIKRQKARKFSSKSSVSSQVFDFHPEDEVFIGESEGNNIIFKYTNEQSEETADSKRAFQDFGILPKGRMILLSKKGFQSAVEKLQKFGSET